ncbi:21729_t:CDS:2 [Entrophospora sp. SA101]|nr:21729_t:CDS:2 [Entrophospora sp. SA101]
MNEPWVERFKNLQKRYKFGLCSECRQPKTDGSQCQVCNDQHSQNNFKNLTSGSFDIDQLIQNQQLNTVFKAVWNEVGPLSNLYIEDEYWLKGSAISDSKEIVLKSLNNSQNVTADFLQEITCNKLVNTDLGKEISRQCKPVLDAEKKKLCKRLSELYKQYKEQSREIEPEESEKVKQDLFSEFCRQNNYEEDNYFYGTKKSRDEFDELLYPTNINKTYQTHSQAIYTSRLLDFPNLSQPQNNLSQE